MRALIVDGDQDLLDVMTYSFRREGYDVIGATDGLQALDRLRATCPDIVVLELNLSRLNGFEVCRRIRKTSDVPILMLTARDEDVDKIIGLEVGADDYLTKPFNPRELVARVKSILRRATPERRTCRSCSSTPLR